MIEFKSKIKSYKLAGGAADEAVDVTENIIPNDVKLPSDAPARMKTLRAEGKKWYLTVVHHEDSQQPFALFCQTNSHDKSAQTSDAVELLIDLALRKGIYKEHVENTTNKCKSDSNVGKLTRVISLLLRHGVLMKFIVAELDKVQDVYVGSFLYQIKKFMSQYIKDGEQVEGETCPNCGSKNLVYQEGCKSCLDCNDSKCG